LPPYQKFASYTASVGVHAATDSVGRESGDATASMARIVKELGVPEGIVGKMVVTRPDDMVWLGPDDLRSMGTSMTGKPAQVPTDQSIASQPPMHWLHQQRLSFRSQDLRHGAMS